MDRKALTAWPAGAWLRVGVCALAGMVAGCLAPPLPEMVEDDQRADAFWLALSRGDVAAAEVWAGRMDDPDFAERARLDLQVATRGRAQVLGELVESGHWLANRYRASGVEARAELARHDELAQRTAVWWLEQARRSDSFDRARATAERARRFAPGGLEGLAIVGEQWLAEAEHEVLEDLLEEAPEGSARLDWLGHRQLAATGRIHAAMEGLMGDLAGDRLPPEGVELLGRLATALPDRETERRLLDALLADDGAGGRWRRARDAVLSDLLARAGRLDDAAERLAAAGVPTSVQARQARRWDLRRGVVGPVTGPAEQCDLDPARVGSKALLALRLAQEWSLAARATYRADREDGVRLDLDGFASRLDEAGAPLGDVPRLADAPRRSFGMFGEMFDTAALEQDLPDAMILGGKGFGQPPELTWYDLVSRRQIDDARAADGSYRECLVRNLRVPGFAAAAGARFTGAGLVHTVFLDLDELQRDARADARTSPGAEPRPFRARTRAERRALTEPLDASARLVYAAAQDAEAAPLTERALAQIAIHEGQHIADAGRFLERNVFGKLSDVVSAGLLPSNVRAELELRAQLAALQQAPDPRLPLADMVSVVPVEGRRRGSEHARGYEELLARFVATLDRGGWDGAVPLTELGIDPDAVLVQQLHRLTPETIRAVARAMPLE